MQKRLLEICNENNITLAKLGRQIGKSRQYMSELARDNIRLTYEMALRIARALKTTPEKLFLGNESNLNRLDVYPISQYTRTDESEVINVDRT